MKMKYISVALFMAISSIIAPSSSAVQLNLISDVTSERKLNYEVFEDMVFLLTSYTTFSPALITREDRFCIELGLDSLDMINYLNDCEDFFCVDLKYSSVYGRLGTLRVGELEETIINLMP